MNTVDNLRSRIGLFTKMAEWYAGDNHDGGELARTVLETEAVQKAKYPTGKHTVEVSTRLAQLLTEFNVTEARSFNEKYKSDILALEEWVVIKRHLRRAAHGLATNSNARDSGGVSRVSTA